MDEGENGEKNEILEGARERSKKNTVGRRRQLGKGQLQRGI